MSSAATPYGQSLFSLRGAGFGLGVGYALLTRDFRYGLQSTAYPSVFGNGYGYGIAYGQGRLDGGRGAGIGPGPV